MAKKDSDELKKYFREIYPHIWEHYDFLFKIRTDNRKFESLLAFESLLTIIFLTLFSNLILNGKIVFVIPLISFLISIIFSLYNLIPTQIYFPWFEKNHIKNIFEKRKNIDFFEAGLREIYGVLDHLWLLNERRNSRFYKNSLIFYISIALSFASVLVYLNLNYLLLLFIPILILAWSIVQKNWSKEVVKKSPADEAEKFFNDWKEEVEKNKKK